MSVFRRPGSKVYSYDFRWRGHRFSGSTGCTERREAERFEEQIRRQARAQTIDLSRPMSFSTASTLYWTDAGQHRSRPEEMERYLAWLQVNVGKSTPVSMISDMTVSRLVAIRRAEGVSNATVNRTVTQPLRTILNRAKRIWKQTVQDIDWPTHLLKEAQERVREASTDEETALLDAVRPDYRPALRFALMSGCRRAEIVGLRWQDVDFFNRQFTVTGKGERSRTIPMTTEIHALLWALKDHHKTAVFTYLVKRGGGSRQPITVEGFKTEWRRARARAGVENFRFHDTRHTAATRLVRATGNLKMAQKLLGHSDIATTSRYAHVTNDDLRAGMEASVTKGATQNATPNNGGKPKPLKKNGNL